MKYLPFTKMKYLPSAGPTWKISEISITQSLSAEPILQTIPLLILSLSPTASLMARRFTDIN
jgi:uncharacterized membrane protein YhaH (DUF805 family)